MYNAASRLRCMRVARKHSTMTLESDRPERGSDDRHNAPASGASGALPPSLENVLPGKTLNQLFNRDFNRFLENNLSVTSCLSVLITASGLQGEKPLANGIK